MCLYRIGHERSVEIVGYCGRETVTKTAFSAAKGVREIVQANACFESKDLRVTA